MELKELADKLNSASTEIKNAQEKLQAEIKEAGEATAETKAALAKHEANFGELKSLFEKMDEKLQEVELSNQKRDIAVQARKSLGQVFVESDEFKSANSSRPNVVIEMDKKDISGLAASAGALVAPDRDPEVYRNPSRPTRIRDLIPSLPASSNAVEFMRQNVFTNNAGAQGTVAGVGGGELALKGQSDITWELVSLPVPTIAHWVPASRQILDDAPQLRGLIDLDLNYGLDLEGDNQLLLGDGTGQNMTGLMVDAAVSDAGQLPSGTAAGDVPAAMIDHIRKAIRICQQNEYYNVNGLILNPVDWETLETAKATDGHYLMVAMPSGSAQQTVWRIPVVVTNAMTAGKFLLGDFTMGAKIRDREQVSVRVAEQHNDLFVKNGVVVLAEERYVLTIPRPKAFCKGDFSVAI